MTRQGSIGGRRVPPRKLILVGVVVLLVIVAAIIGSVVSNAESIAVNDCVVTSPSLLSGYDIKKVSCTATEPAGTVVQKVVSVEGGSGGECGLGLTTFQDQPANKTYCLADFFGG